jgi:hypothetical protein
VNPVGNDLLWREMGAMDATTRKRLIINGEQILIAVASPQHPQEVSIVGGNSRGGGAGAWRVCIRRIDMVRNPIRHPWRH